MDEVIDLTGCDLGRVSPHSPDVPDNFQDISDNENCENTGTFYLIISKEKFHRNKILTFSSKNAELNSHKI